MSTRQSIKYEKADYAGPGYHLFDDLFDRDREYVYLELVGVNSQVDTEDKSVLVEIPRAWAVKLGLVEE